MKVAVFTVHVASRKQPFGELIGDAFDAFATIGHGEPTIRFACANNEALGRINQALGKGAAVDAVGRVVKRFPELARLVRETPRPKPAEGTVKTLSNIAADGGVEPIDRALLRAIADGVPRSFPFKTITIHIEAPGFGDYDALPDDLGVDWQRSLLRAGVSGFGTAIRQCGVIFTDSWWVNGRQRSTTAMRIVDAPDGAKKLPPPPPGIAAALAACGKARQTIQFPLPDAPMGDIKATDVGGVLLEITRRWRARLPELAEGMPHAVPRLPPTPSIEKVSGPKKPALEDAFAPMGYSIRGETGMFRLRRKTAANLTIELDIDVGTWSDLLLAHFRLIGMREGNAFRIAFGLPATRGQVAGEVQGVMMYGQIPIGTPERWRMFTQNLAALVAALEQGFVPEIEAAAGPTPAWFEP